MSKFVPWRYPNNPQLLKNALWFCYLFMCVIIAPNLLAQTPSLAHTVLTKKDGLAIDKIDAIAIDNDGFLWIGGSILDVRNIVKSSKKNMLQRYDGSNFHNIELPEEAGSIIRVKQIYKRTDENFYVQAETSIGNRFFLFNPSTMEFTLIPFTKDEMFADTYSFFFPYQGKDYFVHHKGATILVSEIKKDLTSETILSFEFTEARFLLDASTVLLMHEKYIVIGDDNFPIHFFDWDGNLLNKMSSKEFVRTRNSTTKKPFIESYFNLDDAYHVFFSGQETLQKIDDQSFSFVPSELNTIVNNKAHLTSFNDKYGKPIICTSDTDLDLATVNGTFTYKTRMSSIFKSPTPTTIFSTDVSKDIWVGTGERELHHLKFPSEKIKTFLPDAAMRSITALDALRFLAATETNGWYTINKQTLDISPYTLFENGQEIKPNSSRNIIKEGTTLWSNSNGNLLEINTETRDVKSYRHFPILCLERLNDSTLVYGTFSYNLMAFDTKTKEHYPIIETKGMSVFDIAINNNFLVGATSKGVLTYDFNTKEKTIYRTSLPVKDDFFLMVDYTDELGFVLGGREGDVLGFDRERKTFNTIYKDELKAGIATLVLDNKTLWIHTFNGMVAFNLDNKTSQRFSEADGLSNNEANRYSALKTANGMFVGTLKGLNYFHPDELQPIKKEVTLKLLKLRHYVSDKKQVFDNYNISEINSDSPIIIPTEYKELSLDFGLTNNAAPNEYRYRYKLGDIDWININQDQSLSFPSLSAGRYVLEIEALNFSGNKVGESLVLHIDSKAFFYKKWWFYAGLSLFVISILLYFLQQSRLRQTMQQKFSQDLIGSQEKERKRIAKDLHDSVGQRLTLIKRKTQNQKEIELTAMTNEVLEEVRSISRGLYPANLKVLGLTESIRQLAYDIDEQTDLFMTLELENIDSHFNDQGKLNIYRFVQESFNNILKHAKAKEVSLLTRTKGGEVIIKIEDSGVGFVPNDKKAKHSLGLKTLEERISVVDGKLEIVSKLNTGTKLIATIPIK